MDATMNPSAVEHDPDRNMVCSEFASPRTVVVAQSQFGSPEALSESSMAFLTPEDRQMLATRSGPACFVRFPAGAGSFAAKFVVLTP